MHHNQAYCNDPTKEATRANCFLQCQYYMTEKGHSSCTKNWHDIYQTLYSIVIKRLRRTLSWKRLWLSQLRTYLLIETSSTVAHFIWLKWCAVIEVLHYDTYTVINNYKCLIHSYTSGTMHCKHRCLILISLAVSQVKGSKPLRRLNSS